VCDVCHALKKDITNRSLLPDARCQALRLYRQHIGDQYRDRQALWSVQSVSGEDHVAGVIAILIDGMDQRKFAIPRDPTLRATATVWPCRSCRSGRCIWSQPSENV